MQNKKCDWEKAENQKLNSLKKGSINLGIKATSFHKRNSKDE